MICAVFEVRSLMNLVANYFERGLREPASSAATSAPAEDWKNQPTPLPISLLSLATRTDGATAPTSDKHDSNLKVKHSYHLQR